MKTHFFRNTSIILLSFLATQIASAGNWEYEIKQDKMSSKDTKIASITSENSLDLPFPYQGHNKGFLYIRQKQGASIEVFVAIMKGQIPCPGYINGCSIAVRFDNDKPIKFNAANPSDHSTNAFFINNEGRFLNGAKKATRILIQFTTYGAGDQILEFSPNSPLIWDTQKNKKSK
ncbi:hypothetical protein [Comamonas aquatica]|uniref:hypothetical protein n=1 Tax=Comamonas aquatica TaxID=225991 RepID=UPI0034D4706D